MTKGDMAPENAQDDEGITHGKKTGAFAFVRRDKKVPSCICIRVIMSLPHTSCVMCDVWVISVLQNNVVSDAPQL